MTNHEKIYVLAGALSSLLVTEMHRDDPDYARLSLPTLSEIVEDFESILPREELESLDSREVIALALHIVQEATAGWALTVALEITQAAAAESAKNN